MGRKPVGPALADRIDGSDEAKKRLKVLLETITGEKTMEHACQALNVGKSRLFKLRAGALQAAVESLEAQPLGRPSERAAGEQDARIAELQAEVQSLRAELRAAQIRAELASALPHVGQEKKGRVKKTNRRPVRPPKRS